MDNEKNYTLQSDPKQGGYRGYLHYSVLVSLLLPVFLVSQRKRLFVASHRFCAFIAVHGHSHLTAQRSHPHCRHRFLEHQRVGKQFVKGTVGKQMPRGLLDLSEPTEAQPSLKPIPSVETTPIRTSVCLEKDVTDHEMDIYEHVNPQECPHRQGFRKSRFIKQPSKHAAMLFAVKNRDGI